MEGINYLFYPPGNTQPTTEPRRSFFQRNLSPQYIREHLGDRWAQMRRQATIWLYTTGDDLDFEGGAGFPHIPDRTLMPRKQACRTTW